MAAQSRTLVASEKSKSSLGFTEISLGRGASW
jgi:hypothetical protein